MSGYLKSNIKSECFGCEACVQICPTKAILMSEDEEGFRYPVVDSEKCINCGLCNKVCPFENPIDSFCDERVAFGGFVKDSYIRSQSTSGGAFTAIVDSWCEDDYVIFGAESKGLEVYHTYICDKQHLDKFRKSKYSQSKIGNSYKDVKKFLKEGKKVVFSGTPCQISGLKSYLKDANQEKLLTIEVICEGVPSPLFIRKLDQHLKTKYNSEIYNLDYRYKDMKTLEGYGKGRWDFEVMQIVLQNGKKLKKDRWFNPYWSIWLNHLMSRPSCYKCPFANKERKADISLGDLWGVHLYCPDLYGNNGGSSLVIVNSEKGKLALELAKAKMFGRELEFDIALKYQSPMRKSIDYNDQRELFFDDLHSKSYKEICNKWAKKTTLKLLFQKYVWGNSQKIWFWNLRNKKEN